MRQKETEGMASARRQRLRPDEPAGRETDFRLFDPAAVATSNSHLKTGWPAKFILIITALHNLQILSREISYHERDRCRLSQQNRRLVGHECHLERPRSCL